MESQFAGFTRGGTGAGGERLCAAGRPCSWGAAVNVRDAYVYATQPAENRVVVVDVAKHANPAEVSGRGGHVWSCDPMWSHGHGTASWGLS